MEGKPKKPMVEGKPEQPEQPVVEGKPKKKPLSGPVLAALLAALTTLLALLSAFGGADIARRNHQALLVAALILVLFAFTFGALAALTENPWLAAGGMVLLAAGLGCAGYSALDHRSGRPLVVASLIATKPAHLEVRIERDGLGAGDRMEADVVTYSSVDKPRQNRRLSRVYWATVGPDESGKIALSFQLPVPSGAQAKSILIRTWVAGKDPPPPDCTSLSNPEACVFIVLPGS